MKTFIFHAHAIEGTAATEGADGANIDYLVVPVNKLSKMAAVDDKLQLFFDDANNRTLEGGGSAIEAQDKLRVDLSVTSELMPAATEALCLLLAKSKDSFIKFDAVNSVFDVDNITDVDIINVATSTTVTSD